MVWRFLLMVFLCTVLILLRMSLPWLENRFLSEKKFRLSVSTKEIPSFLKEVKLKLLLMMFQLLFCYLVLEFFLVKEKWLSFVLVNTQCWEKSKHYWRLKMKVQLHSNKSLNPLLKILVNLDWLVLVLFF